ncbi:S-methyl-5'-thioadenosine phosphorylase [Fodinisporobacter ferrooxydans]|uniref:Purine nucleoside phosphorylase n=1 Tax=Fodinisporobacter ferrooxydans TaxID=2901836 RepID=A0ABY4CKJ4_9BACL|nr:S-methyl-5'-thioadenosine phosphorylase [Alicyclobacillaceae bacterium MYW30-H2]
MSTIQTQASYGIIGGTGVYQPDLLEQPKQHSIATPYGDVSLHIGRLQGKTVAFMPRHGKGHAVPPHKVNYRANIWALRSIGVQQILATAAVGSLHAGLQPGSLVLVDQFIDFTKQRPVTFFEGEQGVVHIDMTDPYCGRLRGEVSKAADCLGIVLQASGTYVCTEGPRFETPAEIRMFAGFGGDVVGMTSVPEVVLAKEQEMCYATVAMVTNYCAGISKEALTHREVMEVMQANVANVRELFYQVIEDSSGERTCQCPHALHELGSLAK